MVNLKNRIKSLHKETGSMIVKELCETAQSRLSEINEMRITRAANEELENNILQTLINGIKGVSDQATADFVNREDRYLGIRNLGVRESISMIKNSDVSSHPSLLYTIAQFESISDRPEYLIAENYCNSMAPFMWHPVINETVSTIKGNISKYSEDVTINKALFELRGSTSAYILSGVKESLDEFMNTRTKVSRIKLVEKLNKFNFDPLIRNLSNIIKESTSNALNVTSFSAGTEVSSVYSPVIVTENSEIFSVGGQVYEKQGTNLTVLNEQQINRLDPDFLSIASFLSSPDVRVSEGTVTVYARNKKIEITNESLKINDKQISVKDFTSVYMNAGVFRREEMDMMANINKVLENFNNIVEIDFAKRFVTPNIGNRSAVVIKLNENIFISKTDPHMGKTDFYSNLNGTQAKNLVLEFMNYDISEAFSSLLNEEDARLKGIRDNKREYLSTISKLEEKLTDLQGVTDTDIRESVEFTQIIDILVEEIERLKEEYATLIAEEHDIVTLPDTCGDKSTIESTTDRVYVNELGLEGTVVGTDTITNTVSVLLDNGFTRRYNIEDVEYIESGGLNEARIEIKVNGQKIDVYTDGDVEVPADKPKEDKPKEDKPKEDKEEEPKKKSGKSNDSDDDDEEELDFSALESRIAESRHGNSVVSKIAEELQKRKKAAHFMSEHHYSEEAAGESTSEFTVGDKVESETERYGTVQGVNDITKLVTVAFDDGETMELEPNKLVIVDELGEGAFWPKSNLSDSFEVLLKKELSKLPGVYYVEGLDLYKESGKGPKMILSIDTDKDSVDAIMKAVHDFEKDNINEGASAGDEVELDDGQRAMVQGVDDSTGFLVVLTDTGETLHVPGNTVTMVMDISNRNAKEEEVEGSQADGRSVDFKE